MHVSTHHDRIWQAGCQQKEECIAKSLSLQGISNMLVDAVHTDIDSLPQPFASDNHFSKPANYINLAPEFWHIYRCNPILEETTLLHKYTVLMNRISGERLMLLYKLAEHNLLEKGLVGFNCLYHDKDPDVKQRQQHFANMHSKCGWHKWDSIHKELLPDMPMLVNMDPDTAAMNSDITLVVESYVSDTVIAFSEKIFRALQTPRPWVLFCSPDSVSVLRSYGFDVMDDVVDHDYDSIVDTEQRIDCILKQISSFQSRPLQRYKQAVQTNQALLDKLKFQWSYKLQSILDSNQSRSKIVSGYLAR